MSPSSGVELLFLHSQVSVKSPLIAYEVTVIDVSRLSQDSHTCRGRFEPVFSFLLFSVGTL
jgi:hypothetical protein